MAKMTDYVREGFDRRRRPWDGTELPEWWNLAVWVALAAVGAAIVFAALTDREGSAPAPEADGPSPRFSIQAMNPYKPSPTPGRTASGTPSPAASGLPPSPGEPGRDFTAIAPVQVRMAQGGTVPVPAGARDLALAAAKALATGDWTGIPLAGTATPGAAPKTPTGSVAGELTVTDPKVTGNTRYVFSTSIRHDPAARPYEVKISVERAGSGYAVRPQ